MGRCNAATIGAGAGVGLAMAVIPFAFARPISAKAKKSCGLPYTGREQECLVIYEDGVELFFHNAASRYSESMDVYRIPIENINAVCCDTPTRVLANWRGFLRHGRTPQRAITSPLHPVTSLPLSRLFCGYLF